MCLYLLEKVCVIYLNIACFPQRKSRWNLAALLPAEDPNLLFLCAADFRRPLDLVDSLVDGLALIELTPPDSASVLKNH